MQDVLQRLQTLRRTARSLLAVERAAVNGGRGDVSAVVETGRVQIEHLPLLLDGETSQDAGTFLGEADIRGVLGKLPNKTRLPK